MESCILIRIPFANQDLVCFLKIKKIFGLKENGIPIQDSDKDMGSHLGKIKWDPIS